MAVDSTTSPAAWSELLPELLGRIAACCAKPADRASFRSVCRSWLSAARHHCARASLLPWAMIPDGSFLTFPDGGTHSLTLPENTVCVGSTNSWLALRRSGGEDEEDKFLLHNPFSGTTVPLPDVDAVRTKAPPGVFQLHEVLMRSTTTEGTGIVAFLTDSRSYPFVLSLPGKQGAWTPEPLAPPFMYIVDIAFVGDDKLYGITVAEDLFSFGVALHDDQIPMVTGCDRIIRHPMDLPGHDYVPWSDVDDEDDENGDGEQASTSGGEEEISSSEDEDEWSDYSSDSSSDEYEEDDNVKTECMREDHVPPSFNVWFAEDEEPPIMTIRYLVEANGKLIMVRRHRRCPRLSVPRYTRDVEVLEADTDAGVWVPVDRLGDGTGLALFISRRFSKCVSVCSYGQGTLDEDAIYFMDTGEVFDMRSGAISMALWCLHYFEPTCVLPPDL